MSTIKDPQGKKSKSLKKDRRNVYGENDKSSRKNISRSKQRQHQVERRPMKEALAIANRAENANEIADLAFEAESTTLAKKRKGFAKVPDAALAKVLRVRRPRTSGNMDITQKKFLISSGRFIKL